MDGMKAGTRIAPFDCVLIFLAVGLSCLSGILSREAGYLAWIWPANAILLAMFVRFPHMAQPAGWLSASVAFLAVDAVVGTGWVANLMLNASNLLGIVVGYWIYMRYPPDIRLLQRPTSALLLVGASLAASVVTSAVGSVVSVMLFGKTYMWAFAMWFSSQLTNYLALMPFVLALPAWEHGNAGLRSLASRRRPDIYVNLGIWGTFLGSCALGVAMDGPGAVMLPVPALLWMALTFPLFTTASIVLAYVLWSQTAMSMGIIDIGVDMQDVKSVISLRLGLTLMALGPLAVASTNASRNKLLQELHRLATYDFLTGILGRAAFLRQGAELLPRSPTVLLLMDIDHFKSINDRFGHHVGDAALVGFCKAVGGELRQTDLFGRLGGEEFAVLLPGMSRQGALALAQRICRKVEETTIKADGGVVLRMTVSIGVANASPSDPYSLADLLRRADELLYQAKAGGRNQVVLEPVPAQPDEPSRPTFLTVSPT